MVQHERGETARGCGRPFIEIGKFVDAIFLKREAMFGNRADEALGLARSANQRAEFHEGLIQVGAWRNVKREA